MDVGSFMHLATVMHDRHFLVDMRYVSVKEQLTICLHIVGHNMKNRTIRIEFLRSDETIGRYFNNVLLGVCALLNDLVQPPNGTCHPDLGTTLLASPFQGKRNNNDNKF